jgi:glutamine synthetase
MLVPDPDTAYMDPFTQHRTLNINCYVKDPVTGEMYSRDPRTSRRGRLYLKQTGIADISYWGPEAEFYIFDSIRFDQNQHEGYYTSMPTRASGTPARSWGQEPRLPSAPQGGYFPLPPMDQYQDLRSGWS